MKQEAQNEKRLLLAPTLNDSNQIKPMQTFYLIPDTVISIYSKFLISPMNKPIPKNTKTLTCGAPPWHKYRSSTTHS